MIRRQSSASAANGKKNERSPSSQQPQLQSQIAVASSRSAARSGSSSQTPAWQGRPPSQSPQDLPQRGSGPHSRPSQSGTQSSVSPLESVASPVEASVASPSDAVLVETPESDVELASKLPLPPELGVVEFEDDVVAEPEPCVDGSSVAVPSPVSTRSRSEHAVATNDAMRQICGPRRRRMVPMTMHEPRWCVNKRS